MPLGAAAASDCATRTMPTPWTEPAPAAVRADEPADPLLRIKRGIADGDLARLVAAGAIVLPPTGAGHTSVRLRALSELAAIDRTLAGRVAGDEVLDDAACSLGEALGVCRALRSRLRQGDATPHQIAEVGAIAAVCHAMQLRLDMAARAVDRAAGEPREASQHRAALIRQIVEQGCRDVHAMAALEGMP